MIHKNSKQQGFSLIESLVVFAVIFILAAITIFKSFGSMENYQANSGMDIVLSQLRVARQLAISQRRNVQVQFNLAVTPPKIIYTVQPGNYAGSTEVAQAPVSMPLPNNVSFMGFGEPDTPMAFGTCGGSYGVCIAGVSGGPAIMGFNSEGQFTDSTYVNTLNGTVFLGISGQPETARAVTIMGGTGRIRSYSYIGGSGAAAWTE